MANTSSSTNECSGQKFKNFLSPDRIRFLLDYNEWTGWFTWREKASRNTIVGTRAGHVAGDGYRVIRLDTVRYYEHRLVWLWVYGRWPHQYIDHINLARPDNRLINLREASGSENYGNAGLRKDNSSGFKGVVWYAKQAKWSARICRKGRTINLGLFATPEQAAAAYEIAAVEYFGEFARLK